MLSESKQLTHFNSSYMNSEEFLHTLRGIYIYLYSFILIKNNIQTLYNTSLKSTYI